MKTGVSSYSFSKLLNKGKLNQFAMISKAKEMGFAVMEFSGLKVPQSEAATSFAKKIKEKCESTDIAVGNYTIGADFLKKDFSREVERLQKEVEIAAALGATGIRHDATTGFSRNYQGVKSFETALPALVKGCRAVTEFAADYGLKTMIENHGFFCQDSLRVEKLVNEVNHSNFGVLLDIGNFLCVDENPVKATGRLLPYVFHVHVKDFHVKSGNEPAPGEGWFESRGGNYLRGAIVGQGNVPVMQCLRLVKKSGYNGVLSIEFEGMEEPLTGIKIGLANLNNYLNLLN